MNRKPLFFGNTLSKFKNPWHFHIAEKFGGKSYCLYVVAQNLDNHKIPYISDSKKKKEMNN